MQKKHYCAACGQKIGIGLGSEIRVTVTQRAKVRGKRPQRRVIEGIVIALRSTTLTDIDTGAEFPATDFRVYNEKSRTCEWTGALRDPQEDIPR